MKHILKLITLSLIPFSPLIAESAHIIENQSDQTINKLYQNIKSKHINSVENRIDWISQQFKNKPYLLTALGEGDKGRYDQFPKYRTDAFDCLTFTTTVIALSKSNNLQSFKENLKLIRYKQGKRSYINRNHFTSLDWNLNNQQQGFLKDITTTIRNKNRQPISKMATAIINKPSWYQFRKLDTIRIKNISEKTQKERLEELKKQGKNLGITQVSTPYIPIKILFFSNGEPNTYLFNQIPNASIIEIVRPNWNLKKEIGTCLNISHIGFAIRKDNKLYYRQASSNQGKVSDILLTTYLKNTLHSRTIKGINIQVLNPD